MQDPETYLRAMAAPLAWAQEGSPFPVTRFSLEAVANAFVVLGLLPAQRAEEILAAQRPLLEAAGFRVGLPIGELSVSPDARALQEARAAGASTPEARAAGASTPEIRPPAAAPTGSTEPPWPTPAEAYLAELAPVYDWSIGSFETGTVTLDAPEIVAAVAAALLAVGALPSGSALLTAAQYRERRPARADWQVAVMHMWADGARERVRLAGRPDAADLAVPFPLEQATAVIENITAREDLVSVRLYGHPWVPGGSFPVIVPCFRVTAVDDAGVEHAGMPDSSSHSPAHDGTGSFWFWPPVPTQAKQLRVIVSTLWEAAWALIDIPGR
jgi:hypothetical protein